LSAIVKQLAGRSFVYAIGDILGRGLNYLLVPVFVYFLSPSEYGILAITTTIYSLLIAQYDVIINSPISRFYSDYSDQNERKRFLGTLWIMVIVQGAFITVCLEKLGLGPLTHFFENVPYDPYLRYVVWTTLLVVLSRGLLLTVFRASGRAVAYTSAYVSSAIVKSIAIVFFLWMGQGAIGSLRGEFLGVAIVGIPLLFLTFREVIFSWSWDIARKVVFFSSPLIFHQMAHWILNLSDRIILERAVSIEAVGLYSFAYQFGLGLNVIYFSINNAWFPYFFRNVGRNDRRTQITRLTTYFWMSVVGIGLFVALLSRPVVLLIAPESYAKALQPLPWVLLGYIILGLHFIPINVLYFQKRTVAIAVGTVVAAITNLCLNIWLIPQFGMLAAAINTSISYAVMFTILMTYSVRHNLITYELDRILKFGFSSIVVYGIVTSVYFESHYEEFLVRLILIPSLLSICLLLLRFFHPDEIGLAFDTGRRFLQWFRKRESNV